MCACVFVDSVRMPYEHDFSLEYRLSLSLRRRQIGDNSVNLLLIIRPEVPFFPDALYVACCYHAVLYFALTVSLFPDPRIIS